jgi:hypothetical protein
MVLIEPPEGWISPEESAVVPMKVPQPKELPMPASNGDSAVRHSSDVGSSDSETVKRAVEPPPVQLPISASAEIVAALVPPIPQVPAIPQPAATTPAPAVSAPSAGFTPFELPEVVAGKTFLSSLTQSLLGRVALLTISGLLGLTGVLAVWTIVSHRHHPTDVRGGDEQTKAEQTRSPSPDASVKPKAALVQFDRRWLPENSALIVDLQLSRLANQSLALNSLEFLGGWWGPANESLLCGVKASKAQVRRMTWASSDLTDCARHCVVVIELEEGTDARRLLPLGESVDLGANFLARRPQSGPWPHPLLALDARTLVTGDEASLRQVVARGDARLASAPMELLLTKFLPGCDLAIVLDLARARSAGWQLQANLLDVWPAGKSSWNLLCEAPLALSLSVQSADRRRCDLGLVFENEKKAEDVRLCVEKFVPAAILALPPHIAALKTILPPGRCPAESIEQYRRLLDDLFSALQSARCDTADSIVWLHGNWGGPGLLISAASAIANSQTILADWLIAARAVDQGNHRGLIAGLLSYMKTQDPPRFPEGVVGGMLVPNPQARLSWIAGLLPYLGHTGAGWHVETGYDWNGVQNRAVVSKTLPEVVNPALGPAKPPAGYPVTHYVGVAGVGKDAAELPADHARAGVFGYGRQTRQQDLVRGGASTIAVLGVQDQCGPWAQGGRATVRSLSQRPYINGPDGFGSGQADGMLAGMADGSARFLSKNIDPQLLEQMATVRGGNQVDMAAIEPNPPRADVKPPAVPDRKPPDAANVNPPPANAKPKPLDPLVQANLSVPIASISLPNRPLAEAVQLVSSMSTLPVSFDPDAMQELGVSLHDPISIEVADTTVGKALEEIAARRNMAVAIENGQILLTSTLEHREELRQVRYAVSDLTGNEAQAAADLASLVQKFVAPDSWQVAGGRGTMEVTPGVLRITQSGRVHYQIIVFCEKLRVARNLPTKSRWDPRRFVLTTRTAQAKAILELVTSVNFSAPTTLASMLDQFKQPAGTEFLIDRSALAAAKISDSVAGKFKAEKLAQGEALRELLGPLGLGRRVVDAKTLQITTQRALATRLDVEFYPVGRFLAGQSPVALMERIKTTLRDAVWGEGGHGGAIYYDPPSQTLIVLQSQPVQMAIEAMLVEKAR